MEKKMSLAKLAEPVKIYPQLLKNVRVADKKTARENPEVTKAVDAVAKALMCQGAGRRRADPCQGERDGACDPRDGRGGYG